MGWRKGADGTEISDKSQAWLSKYFFAFCMKDLQQMSFPASLGRHRFFSSFFFFILSISIGIGIGIGTSISISIAGIVGGLMKSCHELSHESQLHLCYALCKHSEQLYDIWHCRRNLN